MSDYEGAQAYSEHHASGICPRIIEIAVLEEDGGSFHTIGRACVLCDPPYIVRKAIIDYVVQLPGYLSPNFRIVLCRAKQNGTLVKISPEGG